LEKAPSQRIAIAMSTTHETTTLVARLSKDGQYAVCANRNCGGRLVRLACGKGGGFPELSTSTRPSRQVDAMVRFGGEKLHDRCSAVVEPGRQWRQYENLWEITDRALREYRRDRTIARGHVPQLDRKERERAERRLSEQPLRFRNATAPPLAAGEDGTSQAVHMVRGWPTYVRCTCGGINRVDRSLLDDAETRWRATTKTSK
jgi:hypothetical protein